MSTTKELLVDIFPEHSEDLAIPAKKLAQTMIREEMVDFTAFVIPPGSNKIEDSLTGDNISPALREVIWTADVMLELNNAAQSPQPNISQTFRLTMNELAKAAARRYADKQRNDEGISGDNYISLEEDTLQGILSAFNDISGLAANHWDELANLILTSPQTAFVDVSVNSSRPAEIIELLTSFAHQPKSTKAELLKAA